MQRIARLGILLVSIALSLTLFPILASASVEQSPTELRWVNIAAKNAAERSAIANLGVSLEAFFSDSVWGFATRSEIAELKARGIKVLSDHHFEVARGGHENANGTFDYPPADARFRNTTEMYQSLKHLNSMYAGITKIESIGKSTEGRDLWALHINTTPDALIKGTSTKPGVIYLGAHHAREHLSKEVPMMFAEWLLANSADPQVAKLLDERDIWFVPIVNPDGVEWDISTGRYKMWRKNRSKNKNGSYGVDLNRNYSYGWGTGGSDTDPNSEVYMGPAPFSEPETRAIRDFVDNLSNTRVLLSVHTYSELILYPWGGSNDPIKDPKDKSVFETMGKTMAAWNGYTPEQASDLYIASGDTVDWAYGTHGIFAFTFELSPKDQFGGGFYPGAGAIDRVFNANLKPMLYMLDVADDPYKVIAGPSKRSGSRSSFLKNYIEPQEAYVPFWEKHASTTWN